MIEKPKPPKMRKVIEGFGIYEDVTDKTEDEIKKILSRHSFWVAVGLISYIGVIFFMILVLINH